MRNPGIFVSTPKSLTPRDLAALKIRLARIALEFGYRARRGERGSIYKLLAAIVSGEVKLRKRKRT